MREGGRGREGGGEEGRDEREGEGGRGRDEGGRERDREGEREGEMRER